ncbi:hypothetical protein GYB22_07500 [bacterium]|nr:hypothetical protein [bacterium]
MPRSIFFCFYLLSLFFASAENPKIDTLNAEKLEILLEKTHRYLSIKLYEAVRTGKIEGYAVYDTAILLDKNDLLCLEQLSYNKDSNIINIDIPKSFADHGCSWENYGPNSGTAIKLLAANEEDPDLPRAIVICMEKMIGFASFGLIDRIYVPIESYKDVLDPYELEYIKALYKVSSNTEFEIPPIESSDSRIYRTKDLEIIPQSALSNMVYQTLMIDYIYTMGFQSQDSCMGTLIVENNQKSIRFSVESIQCHDPKTVIPAKTASLNPQLTDLIARWNKLSQ